MWADMYRDKDPGDIPEPRAGCCCDNCFYGRDALALEILRLRGKDKTPKEHARKRRGRRALCGPPKPKGRQLVTGNFNTRKELVERVLFLYHDTACNMSQIGRSCGVTQATVNSIVENKR
jgi:hypothetical protein